VLNVFPVNLGKDYVKFEIVKLDNYDEIRDIEFVVTSNETEKSLKSDSETVAFYELEEGVDYRLDVVNSFNGDVFGTIPFRTFSSLEEYSYFIDTRAKDNSVLVTVFGHTLDDISSFRPKTYHTLGDKVVVVEDSFKTLEGSINNSGVNSISMRASDSNYVSFSYKTLKVFEGYGKGFVDESAYGYKGDSYLLETGESQLIYPSNPVRINISLVMDTGWDSEVGFIESSQDNMFYAVNDDLNWLHSVNIQAFDTEEFTVIEGSVVDFEYKFIYQNSVNEEEVSKLEESFIMTANLWGMKPKGAMDRNYTLLVVDEAFRIYGGEYSTGQSYSTAYRVYSEMAIHQMYHVWNGWKYGMEFDSGNENWRFWSEGWNRYFSHKILEEMGHSDGFNSIHSYYKEFENMYNSGEMVSILSDSDNYPRGGYEYDYGAVLAYELDKIITRESNGVYELSDVLKYVMEEWVINDTVPSYKMITEKINTLIDSSIDTWWNTYVVNGDRLIIEEFEKDVEYEPGTASDGLQDILFIYGGGAPGATFRDKYGFTSFRNANTLSSSDYTRADGIFIILDSNVQRQYVLESIGISKLIATDVVSFIHNDKRVIVIDGESNSEVIDNINSAPEDLLYIDYGNVSEIEYTD